MLACSAPSVARRRPSPVAGACSRCRPPQPPPTRLSGCAHGSTRQNLGQTTYIKERWLKSDFDTPDMLGARSLRAPHQACDQLACWSCPGTPDDNDRHPCSQVLSATPPAAASAGDCRPSCGLQRGWSRRKMAEARLPRPHSNRLPQAFRHHVRRPIIHEVLLFESRHCQDTTKVFLAVRLNSPHPRSSEELRETPRAEATAGGR